MIIDLKQLARILGKKYNRDRLRRLIKDKTHNNRQGTLTIEGRKIKVYKNAKTWELKKVAVGFLSQADEEPKAIKSKVGRPPKQFIDRSKSGKGK